VTTTYPIQAEGLTKTVNRRNILVGLDLEVPRGAIFGILGPNGAGKTTTIRVLLGLVRPDSGSAYILGTPLASVHTVLSRVGAIIEGPGFVPHLTAAANLARLAAAEGLRSSSHRRAISDALERVGLASVAQMKVNSFSLGMKARLALAGALLAPRDLYIFDEPTNGLDPPGIKEIRKIIRSLADAGATVVISTHLLAEAEQILTHAAFISRGMVVKAGSVEQLTGTDNTRVKLVSSSADLITEKFSRLITHRAKHWFEMALPDGMTVPELVHQLVNSGIAIEEIVPIRASLEERFAEIVGEGFDVS
jgi:ABC-2 type transport system ATP-binding protein